MNKGLKNVALIMLVVVLGALMYEIVQKKDKTVEKVDYSQFLRKVEERKIITNKDQPLIIQGDIIKGFYDNGNGESIKFQTYIAYPDPNLLKFLKTNRIKYFQGRPQEESVFWRSIMAILPWILVLGFIWFMMMRQIQSTGNKAMSFGKSRAKLNPETKSKVTFDDVAGVEEAKEELIEVVDFLKEPQKYRSIGAQIPRGVLLVGPPGTGKTLLARAVAGEAGVPFFSISGSDFVEMFVGVGASRVRDLFAQAKKQVPCIVFIDEIDAVGRLRGAGLGGGHDEREQTLNQLLVEMDGFDENEGIILIAATNRADVLDPALLRPGRFDRQVVVDTPDINGREAILKIHSKKIPLSKEVELRVVAKGTPGFTGADLANVINESALLAARNDRKEVTSKDLDDAKDKVLMGPERKSFYITDEEKEIIAFHEGGHALLSTLLEYGDPIHKVTIIPRGRALGLTQHLPEEEKYMRSKKYWEDEIVILLGGRLSEEIIFNDVTTGASNDIERATAIARRMVTEWGMSDKIGPIHLSSGDRDAVFLGRDYSRQTTVSDEYARKVDDEVKNIIDNAFKRGRILLKKSIVPLRKIAAELLEKETINGEELRTLVLGKSSKKTTTNQKTGKPVTKTSKPNKTNKNLPSGKLAPA